MPRQRRSFEKWMRRILRAPGPGLPLSSPLKHLRLLQVQPGKIICRTKFEKRGWKNCSRIKTIKKRQPNFWIQSQFLKVNLHLSRGLLGSNMHHFSEADPKKFSYILNVSISLKDSASKLPQITFFNLGQRAQKRI